MFIRSFQLSDYASITQLFEKVLCEECYEETMEAFARQLSWDSEMVLVAVKDEQVVGVLIGTIDNEQGYYYRIAVDAAYQRQGIGKQLILSMKRRFEQRRVRKVFISVDGHNESIVPFFESLGYRATDFFRSLSQLSIVSG